MACRIVYDRCKTAGAVRIWGFSWTLAFARRWQPNTGYAVGEAVRPNTRAQTGVEYVSSGGVSRGVSARQPIEKIEPLWPTAGSVQDGPIIWTPRPITYDSLEERIVSEEWTSPAGITAEPLPYQDDPAAQMSAARISGGTKGQTYEVSVLVTTTAGQVHEGTIRVTID